MKIKNVNLEWYAIIWDDNKKNIEYINVLTGIKELLVSEIRKKRIKSRDDLRFSIKQFLMYHYWFKTEMEVAIGGLFSEYPEEFKKVDVYSQLEPNLDSITDYIIDKLEVKL